MILCLDWVKVQNYHPLYNCSLHSGPAVYHMYLCNAEPKKKKDFTSLSFLQIFLL